MHRKRGPIIFICVSIIFSFQISAQKIHKPTIGIVENMVHDSLLKAAGYGHLVESVSRVINPRNVNDSQFEKNLIAFKSLKLPLFACNLFMPGELKLVGPVVDEMEVMTYAEKVFQRCNLAGINNIVWGSGGSRRVPDGFDRAQAKIQLIYIAKKVALLAKKHKIMLLFENINSTETNFINTAYEALEIVKAVNHPNFKLSADIYHMLKENESAQTLLKAKKYLYNIEIAEKENRAAPGVAGTDFKDFLIVLKKIGYTRHIDLECRWTNLQTQAAPAFLFLQKQIDEVYSVR